MRMETGTQSWYNGEEGEKRARERRLARPGNRMILGRSKRYLMKLGQEIFAIKLYEMETQYGLLQSRIQICEQEDQGKIRKELEKAKDEYHQHTLALQKSIQGCRSPAVMELAKTQEDFCEKMESLLKTGELAAYLHCEKSSPEEDKAEAATLYAEYALDYAVQTMQYALIAALSAMDLQANTEQGKGES